MCLRDRFTIANIEILASVCYNAKYESTIFNCLKREVLKSMKKFTERLLVASMVVSMVGAMSATSAFASDVTAGDDYISNEYLKVCVEERHDNLQYYIDTTGGNPDSDADNNAKLLYHTTSKTFAEVDGECRVFGWATPVISAELGSITVSNNYKNVDFTKSFTFVPNKVNGREDVVEIRFTATNNSNESHQVGSRIMLDTMLGENDAAPFRVAGIGAVTTRTQLNSDSIPESYQAFDSLDNPTVVSTGSFATGSGKPDIVQFNRWRTSNDNVVLVPECDAELTIGDSAVNAIWNPVTLAPGESKSYVVYYGIGEVQVSNNAELVLGATRNESAFEVNEDGTGYNPVAITGYLKNSGEDTLNNVEMSIDLPSGVTLVNGENPVKYDTMNVNAENQSTWTLNATPSDVERTVTITVNAKSDEVTNVEPVVYTYTIPALENLPTEPETEPATEPETEPETEPATEPETDPETEPATFPDTEPTTVPYYYTHLTQPTNT